MSLSLQLFGPLQLALDGQPLPRSRALKLELVMVYLCLEQSQRHERKSLAAFFFPDKTTKTAQSNFRQTLTRLRRLLDDESRDPPFLVVTRQHLELNKESGITTDVDLFAQQLQGCPAHEGARDKRCPTCIEQAQSAMSLYNKELLEGHSPAIGESFDEWLRFHQERLHRMALAALDDISSFYEYRGERSVAIEAARRRIALDPWSEEAHTQLMRLLVAQGQRHAALAQYKQCVALLQEELGASPSVALQEWVEQLQQDDDTVGHHLPSRPLRELFGREAALEALQEATNSDQRRWLTLVGMGGIGKTHLALEWAWRMTEDAKHPFVDGLFYLSLPDQPPSRKEMAHRRDWLLRSIAEMLSCPLPDQGEILPTLQRFLAQKECLLLFDNGECLDEASTAALYSLLKQTDYLRYVVLSRRRLRVAAEYCITLEGLDLPHQDEAPNPSTSNALRLFLNRAAQERPELTWETLPPKEQQAIVSICQEVEGAPLAIELVASWCRLRSCQELLLDLRRSSDWLSRETTSTQTRHKSIHAAFASSWQWLTSEAREALSALAHLQTPFSLESAERITGTDLPMLGVLLDRSLLQVTTIEDQTRYRFHPLIRQFAKEQQSDAQSTQVARQHALFFGQRIEEHTEALKGPQAHRWMRLFRAEFEDLSQGWKWAITQQDTALLLRYAEGLLTLCTLLQWFGQGQSLFHAVLALYEAQDPPKNDATTKQLLSLLRFGLGTFAYCMGQWEEAESILQNNLSRSDQRLHTSTCLRLGQVAQYNGQLDTAAAYVEQGIELAHTHRLLSHEAHGQMYLGAIRRDQGRPVEALDHFAQSLDLFRKLHLAWGTSHVLRLFASSATAIGEFELATVSLEESLMIAQDRKDTCAEGLVWCAWAELRQAEGEWDEAVSHYQKGIALLHKAEDPTAITLNQLKLGGLYLQMDTPEKAKAHLLEGCKEAASLRLMAPMIHILLQALREDQLALREPLAQPVCELLQLLKGHPQCPQSAQETIHHLLPKGQETPTKQSTQGRITSLVQGALFGRILERRLLAFFDWRGVPGSRATNTTHEAQRRTSHDVKHPL